jgi:SAM-dependent methyltransferase
MAIYYPQLFDVKDSAQAKQIILTDEGPGADTETRWHHETPYLVELFGRTLSLRPNTLVTDYGCGIGRISKALIDTFGCGVIGVDISPNMRSLAVDYVGSDRFLAVSPAQYDLMVRNGMRVDAAVAIWVLQHCLAPADDINRINGSLITGGGFFVLNMFQRLVPAVQENGPGQARFVWASDSIDIAAMLHATFLIEAEGRPDMSRVRNTSAYWMCLRRHGR